ncbi:MAG: vWA domain-containing protein [Spirochaetota bacterium]
MTFANPLGLLLLLSLPVIALLHLFRQERKRREVSSIFLWREVSDQQSRRVRPRLLRNVNLLLQLLAALLASFALAQPVVATGPAAGSQEIVVLVDDSASMQTAAGGMSHLGLARNRARDIIGRAPRNARILLASAGPSPRIVQPYTSDRALLYERLSSIEPTDGASDLRGALELVRGLGTGDRTDVVLVTDGATSFPDDMSLPHGLSTIVVGGSSDDPVRPNVAITLFELRARPNGRVFEALIGVGNYSPAQVQRTLELIADGEIVSERTLSVPAGEERLVTAAIPRTEGIVYEARLAGNEDELTVDDHAYAAAAGDRPIRVQLVTAGNLFLESFLSVYPNVQLTVTESVDQASPFDILILDDVPAPARLRGNVVALGAVLPDGPFTIIGTDELDRPASARTDHPVTRGVTLDQVQVSEFIAGELSRRANVLVSAGPDPLLYTYQANDLRLVATTFSLTASDLALRSSFPVLMNNIIQWLAPVAPAGEVGYVEVGSVVPLYVPAGEEIAVILPDGTTRRYTPRTTPFEFAETARAGIYNVRGESFAGRFAVSLASSDESDLRRRLGSVSGDLTTASIETAAARPIRQWLALAALLLLAADWVVWARRH